MGSTYTRQSTFTDGDTITADLFNTEFDQLVAAFAASSGHSHDGTAGEGGPIGGLITPGITLGDNTIDVTLTFDGGSNDGVLKWMEDEDYFEFSDDILIASTEKLQFRDTAIYINSSADGQLDLVADTEIQIAATTIDINGAADISGNLAVGGNLTVTGTTTFNGGTITLGDAAADNVVFGADVDSSIIPDDDDTYDLGSSSQQWRNLFIDGTAEIDTLAINGTTVTSTAAELNILDGVTATAAELNILDGVTATATELNIIDGVTATTAELNILDGVTSTAAELNILDGKAFLDEDNFASNSATGIASQQSIKAYVDGVTTTSITSTGALNAGSITSGFGNIDNGSSTITTTGLISGGSLDIDNVLINGTTIGHTDDTDLITLADGVVTVAGEVSMTTLDIGGTNVTSTAAELNALDGITAVVGELNALDLGSTAVGTAIASKAVVLDSNKDYTGIRNFTITGNLSVGGTTTVVDTVTMNAQNAVLFEGATADAHETTLTIVDPTADRTINLPNQSGTVPVLAAASNTAVTSTPEELNILDGVTATAAELNILDVSNSTLGDLSEISTVANDDVFLAIDTSGGGLKKLTRSTIVSGLATSGAISNIVEDTSPQLGGNLDTNSHNILIDDAHFIGDENGNEQIVFQTTSSAVNQIEVTNAASGSGVQIASTGGDTNIDLKLLPKGSGQVVIDGNVGIESGLIDLKNAGAVSKIKFYCESSNAHAQTLQGAPHSEAASNTLTLPSTGGDVDLVSTASTATLTNKTLTSPKINEDVAVTSTATELNLLDGVTATTAELNILDGVTATAAELNILDGVTSTAAELNVLDGITAVVGELNALDLGDTAVGTAIASKAMVLDSNKDYTGIRNFTLSGELDAGSLDISGNADIDGTLETDALSINGTTVTSTAAELNILDGVTSTAAELNALDGITAVVGELNALDLGSTAVGTAIASKAMILDSNKDYTGVRNFTLSGELDAGSLDISGNADIDGTLEADAITIGGVSLAETISDTVGAMVSSNTESGITVAYQDADNTLDFTIGTLNQNTTGSAATLTTARAIAVAGDVTGSANFDGSAGISITTTLATDAIVTANITDGNVTTAKLAADAVTGAKIADNAINSEHYTDGSIDREHLAADIIDGTKIANDAINSEHYAAGSIDNEHIADNAINSEHYADGSIDRAHLAADIIDGTKIANDVINSEHYVAGSIDAEHLASNSVTEAKVAANSIDSQAYVDGSIDQVHLANAIVNEAKMQISNSPTNGYVLTAQSGNTGGLTWAAAGGGATEFISSVDISSDANYTFTGFDDSKYDNYIFYLAAVTPATDGEYLTIQTSTNGGSSYSTSEGDYTYITSFARDASVVSASGINNSGYGPYISRGVGTATDEQGGIYGTISMNGPHLAQYTRINSYLSYRASPGVASTASEMGQSVVTRMAAEDVDAFRLSFYNGNIASGTITAYGLKNS